MPETETETVTVAARFCGPPGSGNGGYVAGLAAQRLGAAPATAMLIAPPPLDRPLSVTRAGNALTLSDGDTPVVHAAPGTLALEVPAAPGLADAKAAAARYAGFTGHIFPGCFVCGPARAQGDGLRIFAGAVAGRDLVAAPWTPDASLAAADGLVAEAFVWAALDCPSYFALPGAADTLTAVLGRMTAEVLERPAPGAPLVVAAWAKGSEGRKHASASALYDADGRVLAKANCLWIELRAKPEK